MVTWLSASGGVLGVVQRLLVLGLGTLFLSKVQGQQWGRFGVVARGWRPPIGDVDVVFPRQAFCSRLDRFVPIWFGSFVSDLWESSVARWLVLVGSGAVAGAGTGWEVPASIRRGCCDLRGSAGPVGSSIRIWALAWAWALARTWAWALILICPYFNYSYLLLFFSIAF